VGSEYLLKVGKEDVTGPSSRLQALLGFVERPDIAWTIIVLNFIGFVGGTILWYGEHFLGRAAGKWYLWPFIPDCPGFAFLFIIAFLGLRHGRHWRLFNTITAYGLIKYGVWTVLYWIAYWSRGGPVEPLGVTMFLSHLGMIGEGLYVSYRILSPIGSVPMPVGTVPQTLPSLGRTGAAEQRSWGARERESKGYFSSAPVHLRTLAQRAGFRRRDVLIAFAWFLLSDYVDYGLGQYPMFDTAVVPMALMKWHTIFMTLALAAVYLALSKRRRAGW